MGIFHIAFVLFLLSVGASCLLVPRSVQRFIIAFDEKYGNIEAEDSFRKSEKYISRLRKLGAIVVGGAILLSMAFLWADEWAVFIVEKFDI